jgi:hypothetical protein
MRPSFGQDHDQHQERQHQAIDSLASAMSSPGPLPKDKRTQVWRHALPRSAPERVAWVCG